MGYPRVRELREARGLSQRELAQLLNVKQTTYSKYELGGWACRWRRLRAWRISTTPVSISCSGGRIPRTRLRRRATRTGRCASSAFF